MLQSLRPLHQLQLCSPYYQRRKKYFWPITKGIAATLAIMVIIVITVSMIYKDTIAIIYFQMRQHLQKYPIYRSLTYLLTYSLTYSLREAIKKKQLPNLDIVLQPNFSSMKSMDMCIEGGGVGDPCPNYFFFV